MTMQFPVIQSTYSRPTLLQAGLSAQALEDNMPVTDAEFLLKQVGKKKRKALQRLAPLLVHKLIHTPSYLTDEARELLHGVQGLLEKDQSTWSGVYFEASMKGVRPTELIFKLPKASQQAMLRNRGSFQSIHKAVEEKVSKFFEGYGDSITGLLSETSGKGEAVSLKKMVKSVPSVK